MVDWDEESLADPVGDLCGTATIKVTIDVVSCYDGTWTAYFDNDRIKEGFSTREAAKEFLENFLKEKG